MQTQTEAQQFSSKPVVVTKLAHLILALAVYLLSLGAVYGTMRAQMDEAQRRMQELELRKVDQKQFDEMREDILRRLQRIEDKIDRDRELRKLH